VIAVDEGSGDDDGGSVAVSVTTAGGVEAYKVKEGSGGDGGVGDWQEPKDGSKVCWCGCC